MNKQILDFFKSNLTLDEVNGKNIIELGSRYINGSVRPDIEIKKPASYIGVDIEKGRYVDIVCPINELLTRYTPASFDIVISTELLEHVVDFRETINIIKLIF